MPWLTAGFILAGVAAGAFLAVIDADLNLLVAYGACCWLGGVFWQRLLDMAEAADEEEA